MVAGITPRACIPIRYHTKPSRIFKIDGYAWSYTKSGAYTMKSGYVITTIRKELERPVLEPSITAI